MATLISDRDTALLLLKIRNLVAEETGIRIPLSEEGAVDRFLELADETENQKIKQVAAKLREMTGKVLPAEDRAPAGHKVRVYRGVVQAVEERPDHDELRRARGEAPPKKGKVITYRGRKMVV